MQHKNCLTNLPICKGSCCRNGVWVDVEQARRIQEYVLSQESLKDLHDKTLFVEEDIDPDYFPSGKGVGTNLQSENGPCIFLDAEYKCRIYPVRPHFCSDYPFMSPVLSSPKPIVLDNMFERDPNCIYHEMLHATLKSIEEERADEEREKGHS
jgi:Fe-S-cluster containining protein